MPPFDKEQQGSAEGLSRTAIFAEQHRYHEQNHHHCQGVSPHDLMVVDVLKDVSADVTSFSNKKVPNLVREESSDDSDSSSSLESSKTTEASSNSSSPTSPMARKQVHFYPYGESVHIATIDEYTDEEIAQCWYSEEEMEDIRDSNQYIIRLDNEERLHSSNEVRNDSTRGLEPQTHRGYLAMRKIRSSSVACVLLEQRRQQMLGINHQEFIREVYQPFSVAATSIAIQQAEKDVKESLTKHNDPLSWCLEQYFSSDNQKSDVKSQEPRLCWGLLDPSSWLPKSTIAPMIPLHD